MSDDDTNPDEAVKDPEELEGDIDEARRALDDIQRIDTDTSRRAFVEEGNDEDTDDTIVPPG